MESMFPAAVPVAAEEITAYPMGTMHAQYFTPDVRGIVKGVRYWRWSADTLANRAVELWRVSDAFIMHSENFSTASETASGWQTFTFDDAHTVYPGETYCVAFNTKWSMHCPVAGAVESAPHLSSVGSYSKPQADAGGMPDIPSVANYLFADVLFVPMAVTATPPLTIAEPVVVVATGLPPGSTVDILREVGGVQERRAVELMADSSGTVTWKDWSYPFGAYVTYIVDYEFHNYLRGNSIITPSSAAPVIRDLAAPEALWTPTIVVDVTQRLYGGRVNVYRAVSEKYPITYGDLRQASEGQLVLFCLSHADRDRTIAVMSTGFPCVLRVPPACHSIVDDMYFTPINITEERWGTQGKVLLTVEFVEVDGLDVPSFTAVTYAEQTENADAQGMDYAQLTYNFTDRTYVDLFLSSSGINWS